MYEGKFEILINHENKGIQFYSKVASLPSAYHFMPLVYQDK